jgi:hypothetical protein
MPSSHPPKMFFSEFQNLVQDETCREETLQCPHEANGSYPNQLFLHSLQGFIKGATFLSFSLRKGMIIYRE